MKRRAVTKQNAVEVFNNVLDNSIKAKAKDFTSDNSFKRNRKLPLKKFVVTCMRFGGSSISKEIFEICKDDGSVCFTDSAFCQARGKVSYAFLEDIFHKFNLTNSDAATYRGYRLYAMDGCDFTTPFSRKSAFLVTSGSKRPYCQIHANLLYDIMNNTYEDIVLQPKTAMDERRALIEMAGRLPAFKKQIIIADRGLTGLNVFESLNRFKDCYYIIRCKSGVNSLAEISKLPSKECDSVIKCVVARSTKEYEPYANQGDMHRLPQKPDKESKTVSKVSNDKRWAFETPCVVKFRVVKVRINDADSGKEEWEVLATNLPKSEFSATDIKDLYGRRWSIETSFRNLKYSVGCIAFHARKDEYILQEIFAHLIAYNLVSRCIKSARLEQRDTKHEYAISYSMAVRIVNRCIGKKCFSFEAMVEEMSRYRVAIRKNRKFERNIVFKGAIYVMYSIG